MVILLSGCASGVADGRILNWQFTAPEDLLTFSPDDQASMNYEIWDGRLKFTVNGRGYSGYNYGSCFADLPVDGNCRYLMIDIYSLQWEFKVQLRDSEIVLLQTEKIGLHTIDLLPLQDYIGDGVLRLVFFMVGNEYDGNRVLIESIYQSDEAVQN